MHHHKCCMEGIVLLNPIDAKEKLLKENLSEEIVAAIVALGPKQPALMSALVECVCSDDTAQAIAQRYCIHPSMLSHCSRAVGLPKRRRGRRPLPEPTLEHLRILDLVRTNGVAETARHVGVSKQRICYVVKQWAPGLKGPSKSSKIVNPPPRKRGPRRTVIVSFRLSMGEWNQLLALEITAGQQNLSGRQKARAILLYHIGQASAVGKLPAQGIEDTVSNAAL